MFWTRTRPELFNATMNRNMDAFNRFFGNHECHQPRRSAPAFNVWGDDDGVVLTSEMSGVELENLEITVSGRDVSVKGERKEDAAGEKSVARRERGSGAFERAFQLPFQIDTEKVTAQLVNGVLEVTLPRAEKDKPRKINVAGS